MVRLRPLLVLTGTIHVEGGDRSERRDVTEMPYQPEHADRVTVVLNREVSDDRRRANVLFVYHSRRLRKLRLYKTPSLGSLVDPRQLPELKAQLANITRELALFNSTSTSCKMWNCIVWEPLQGNRKSLMEGWVSRKVAEGEAKILRVLPELVVPVAPVPPEPVPVETAERAGSGERSMNVIERLKARLARSAPTTVLSLDMPADSSGTWWLDVVAGNGRQLAIEWRPSRDGFGISYITGNTGLGGSDERFLTEDATIARIQEYLNAAT